MKPVFSDIIYDITQLLGIFPKNKLKVFLEKKHGVYEKSTSRGLIRAEHLLGTEALLKQLFSYFYPKHLIIIDDLYAICTSAAIERRCHFSFVPYQVRVYSLSTTSKKIKKRNLRLKGKRIYVDDSEQLEIHLPNPTAFLKHVGAKSVKLVKNLKKGDLLLVFDPTAALSLVSNLKPDQISSVELSPTPPVLEAKGIKTIFFEEIAHRIPKE